MNVFLPVSLGQGCKDENDEGGDCKGLHPFEVVELFDSIADDAGCLQVCEDHLYRRFDTFEVVRRLRRRRRLAASIVYPIGSRDGGSGQLEMLQVC